LSTRISIRPLFALNREGRQHWAEKLWIAEVFPKDVSSFAFLAGEYVIDAYAKILNQHAPKLLRTVKVALTHELAAALCDHTQCVVFTWGPDSQQYRGDVLTPTATEGRSRSASGAGRGKLPWNL
jgi:hypothetical protein